VGGTASQVVGRFAMKYDSTTQQYIYNWKLTTTTRKWGLTNLTVTVTYPGEGGYSPSPAATYGRPNLT
jgi:hypothetical protein